MLPRRDSLSLKVFLALILGELLFAVVLGATIGAFTAIANAQQHQRALRQVSATIAAGLMPMIADQQQPQVQAQLESILEGAPPGVTGICLSDSAGDMIACRGGWKHDHSEPERRPTSPLAVLFEEQVILQPVVVDGLTVAVLRVRFAPEGISALALPTAATAVVLLSVMIVSVPWTAWRLSLDVMEPLDVVGRYASRIAEGELDAPLERRITGEIGELQDTLGRMAQQLKDRDEELRSSYADLFNAFESLEKAKREIEQLSEVKSNFVAVAAHEIRSPLSTISLYTELLEAGEMGTLERPAMDAVAAISAASSRLAIIVSDLMDSALLERGLMSIRPEDIWLEALLEEAAEDAAVTGRARQMQVSVVGGVPDIVIRGDLNRLRQVLDNLLSNAIKYSPPGTRVRVTAREAGGWIEIDVADEGRGIPKGAESKLFALFGRLDFGDSRDTAGLGLGLAISARIVEAHGGHIYYRSNGDEPGSVFTVRLPKAGPELGTYTYPTVSAEESDDQQWA